MSLGSVLAQAPVSPSTNPSQWATFASFSALHLAVVAVMSLLVFGSCRLGLLWRPGDREKKFRRAWGCAIVAAKAAETVYLCWPGVFTIEDSLPIQMCDLAAVAAAIAMLTQRRWSRTLLYYWGIGLSTQALVTPTLDHGPASPRFWFFWCTHLMIVGSAVYDLVVLGYRPHRRDFGVAWTAAIAWVLLVTAVNVPTGLNYGFIGNTVPMHPTIINRLGPWPQRVLIVIGIATAWFAVMTWAWPAVYRLIGRTYPPGVSDERPPGEEGATPRCARESTDAPTRNDR
ncbi:MAG: TIGR02206 family membrane protein [Phycisphaerales bacterium]|nr:TIGR02206 family membrane protein [Phycisphaerales bacterium]